ncbi:response regulator transcription factor [Pectinatus haikarae]|uniref:DNA-binding response OmpR family regulator n=1 Tax=Pectinatus haikarae TaxID=349096 RepID=A0ABT9Y6E7_9FIRM|nr:response regulator transcription factor [Pectinatus haikarae]MDQ0202724.1 DNA-binding response OmpR family regulator [Pectinatus haikarae]
MKKILIVEDDRAIAELERDYLEASNFTVVIAYDGKCGLKRAVEDTYDLLLLDIMLPGIDGFQICREVRKVKNTPILMVSAKHEDIDKIRGLGLGADDYVIKPFSPSELVARVKAHIARYERLTGMDGKEQKKILQSGDLEIQLETHRVFLAEQEITLPHREFELLSFLAENPGIVFSKEKLFERVWGLDAAGDTATVMVHVNRIRDKIEQNPSKPIYIETVWGAGYRFRK